MVSGRVRIVTTGRTMAFTTPSTAAAISSASLFENVIPLGSNLRGEPEPSAPKAKRMNSLASMAALPFGRPPLDRVPSPAKRGL